MKCNNPKCENYVTNAGSACSDYCKELAAIVNQFERNKV